MTCKVKVTAPDGSSTIARTLIDPGSSTSFVHERFAQHLRLSRITKTVIMEGLGGTSTPTRGSVWFQVSGVVYDAEKIGVEAYVLKKITMQGSASASYPTFPQHGPYIQSNIS